MWPTWAIPLFTLTSGFFVCVFVCVCLCLFLDSPRVKISQRRMPYDHTSLKVVYKLWKILSGAIHFRGRKVWMKKNNTIHVRKCYFEKWDSQQGYNSPDCRVLFLQSLQIHFQMLFAVCYLATIYFIYAIPMNHLAISIQAHCEMAAPLPFN